MFWEDSEKSACLNTLIRALHRFWARHTVCRIHRATPIVKCKVVIIQPKNTRTSFVYVPVHIRQAVALDPNRAK